MQLAILDFYQSEVAIYTLPGDSYTDEEIVDFMEAEGYRVKNCEYMFGNFKTLLTNAEIRANHILCKSNSLNRAST